MTILVAANAFPPCLCRLMARRNGKLVGIRELAARSGISRSSVQELSLRADWSGVPLDIAERFSLACGVNFLQTKRINERRRRETWLWLSKTPATQRRMISKLLAAIQSARQS